MRTLLPAHRWKERCIGTMLCGHTGPDQAANLAMVGALTAVWWACAVGVTVVLKAALDRDAVAVAPFEAWNFPYPLTLTLLANIGTAAATGVLSTFYSPSSPPPVPVLREPTPERLQHGSGCPVATPRTMVRASSREALLQETVVSASHGPGGYAGCPGPPSLLGSCGCWRPRRPKHGHLIIGEIFEPEPPLSIAPPEDEFVVGPPLSTPPPPPLPHRGLELSGLAARIGPHVQIPSQTVAFPRDMLAEQRERYVALIVMGVIQGLGLGAKNEALQMLSVATRTMIFALNVLVVMLIARIFGLETLERMKLVSAFFLAGGGMMQGLATWQQLQETSEPGSQMQDEPLGYALALLALVLDALRWVILQATFAKDPPQPTMRTLPASPTHRGDVDCAGHPGTAALPCEAGGAVMGAPMQAQLPPLTKLQMVSWVMWMTTPVCLGLSLVFEPDGLTQVSRHPTAVTGLVTLLTIGVMGINLAEFGIVQWTSAVTFNVLSQLHSIPLILAGVTLFGEEIAAAQVLGFGICLLGALLYSYTKLKEKKNVQHVLHAGASEMRPMSVEIPFAAMPRPHDELLRRHG